jgi:glutathione S-transferase
LFAPSVIEPGATAKMSEWEFKASRVGWGTYESMLAAMESAVGNGDFVLGDTFSMADVIFGGTLRFMLQFEMVEARPAFVAYNDRLSARPALQRSEARNAAIIAERKIGQ